MEISERKADLSQSGELRGSSGKPPLGPEAPETPGNQLRQGGGHATPLGADPWLSVFDEDELEETMPEPTDFDLAGMEELENDFDSGWSMAG